MPFNPQYIDVANLNPNIGLGVSIPFTNSNIFTSTYTTQEAIKSNLINYFLTNPGEIPLKPTFGEALDNLYSNKFQILHSMMLNLICKINYLKFFPTVKINKLDILSNTDDENSIIINLQYSVNNTNSTGSLTFNFNI